MNRRIIIGLVILMGISLLGIVAVQLYWFNNSVAVRNELFDRSVNEAMNKTVKRMETGHDLKVIRDFAEGDTINWNKQIPFPPPPPPPPPSEFENMDVVVKRDTLHNTISVTTSKSGNSKTMSYVVMSGSNSRKRNKSVKTHTENHYSRLNDSDSETKQLLSPKEAALLLLLCEHRDELLPREVALKRIWGDDGYFTTRSMDVFIPKLRKFFKDDPSVEIRNIHGSGFIMTYNN